MSSATYTLPARRARRRRGSRTGRGRCRSTADRRHEGAFGVELLDAVVVVVGDEHLAGVGGDAARVGELAGALRPWCPRRSASPPFEVEALDPVVAAVGDVHVAGGHGDAAAGRLREVLRGAEVELPDFAAVVAPGGDEGAAGVELLDPVVARVDHVDVAGGVGGDAADRPELAVTAAEGAPLGLERAGRAELLHHVAELVGHVDVARRSTATASGKRSTPSARWPIVCTAA